MSTTRSLMGSAKVLRLELSTTPGGVPDQTLNFGVGNMIDMNSPMRRGIGTRDHEASKGQGIMPDLGHGGGTIDGTEKIKTFW